METVCSLWSIHHCPLELDVCQQDKLNHLWVALRANKLLNAPNWKLFINNQKIFWLSWHSAFWLLLGFILKVLFYFFIFFSDTLMEAELKYCKGDFKELWDTINIFGWNSEPLFY